MRFHHTADTCFIFNFKLITSLQHYFYHSAVGEINVEKNQVLCPDLEYKHRSVLYQHFKNIYLFGIWMFCLLASLLYPVCGTYGDWRRPKEGVGSPGVGNETASTPQYS